MSQQTDINSFFQVKKNEDPLPNSTDIPNQIEEVDTNLETIIEEESEIDDTNQKQKKQEKEEELEKILQDQEIEEIANDFSKIEERQENKKKQIELLLRMFKLLNYDIEDVSELTNLTIQRDILLHKNTKQKFLDLIPEFKLVYKSSYLNCLHDNSIYKQKFPAINIMRQVLKCNYLSLTPKIVSNGYEKVTGKKKVSRIFTIEKEMY
jgi:hypothetical protein